MSRSTKPSPSSLQSPYSKPAARLEGWIDPWPSNIICWGLKYWIKSLEPSLVSFLCVLCNVNKVQVCLFWTSHVCCIMLYTWLSYKCRVFNIRCKIREAVRNLHIIVANPRPVSHTLNDHGLPWWNSLDLMNNPCPIPIGSFTHFKFKSRQSCNKSRGNIRVYLGLHLVRVFETGHGFQTMYEVI